jgi:hypothetical protein
LVFSIFSGVYALFGQNFALLTYPDTPLARRPAFHASSETQVLVTLPTGENAPSFNVARQ